MASTPQPKREVFRFGAFQLNAETGELCKFGIRLKISGQPIEILLILIENRGELVRREELRDRLWSSDTFVDFEHSVNAAVKRLRQALDDDVASPRYIETVPRKGYRFIAELLPPPELDLPKPTKVSRSPLPFKPDRRKNTKPTMGLMVATAAIVLLAALSIGLWMKLRSSPVDKASRLLLLQNLTEVPLAALPGNALSPSFSPDGSQIAFAWDGGDNDRAFDLYVKSVGTDAPLRLTHARSEFLSVAWAPDGQSIAISRVNNGDAKKTGIFLIPSTGGPERKLLDRNTLFDFGDDLSWSPDGRRLAFVDHRANSFFSYSLQVFLYSFDTQEVQEVSSDCPEAAAPSFSPKGDVLAWVCADNLADRYSIRLFRLADKSTTELIQQRTYIFGIGWSQGADRILYSTFEGDLREIALTPGAQPLKLPVGRQALDVTSNPAVGKVAYSQGFENQSIWRIDLTAKPARAERLINSTRGQRAPAFSPSGNQIAFESDRSGTKEVWVSNANGSESLKLSSFGTQTTGTPRWSPDGEHIIFDSRPEGRSEIYIVEPTGGVPRKINFDVHSNSLASFSADGHWIYFDYSDSGGNTSIWKAPATGGHAVQVAANPASYALESLDGKFFYFVRDRKIWRARTDGAESAPVKAIPQLSFLPDQWTVAKDGIYFISHENNKTDLEVYDFQRGMIRPVYSFGGGTIREWIGSISVSRDSHYLLIPVSDVRSSGLAMIENWR
jgi:Tol biopolymer transport system component/DNA-binding winged helix-turn-helix (wHTH) protein